MKRLSNKERVVLDLLVQNRGGLYGLQLVEQSGGDLRRGGVYVILGRMEEQGLVDAQPEMPPPGYGGLPRPVYTITGLGEEARRLDQKFARRARPALARRAPTWA